MPPNSPRATSIVRRRLPVSVPYRLDLTANVLRRLSSNVVDRLSADGVYSRALDGFSAPAIVSVRQPEAEALEVELDAPPGEEERALALVTRMLGVERDLRPFERRAAKIPWLRPLAKRMRGVKPPRYPTLWEACVNAVVFQQISLFAAAAILRRVIEALGVPIARGETILSAQSDDVLYAFPGPQAVLEASDATLGAVGLSTGKQTTLRRIAGALLAGSLDEAMLEERSSLEAAALLTQMKGIGPWTAAVVLLRGLGRLDVFPMKDSGIARGLTELGGGPIDLDAALDILGNQRGMLYYHVLLSWLESRGDVSP
jgi:DNA-3-methyladenine glycosylase II